MKETLIDRARRLHRENDRLREALREAERRFSELLELSIDNTLWKTLAHVGAKDARTALTVEEPKP